MKRLVKIGLVLLTAWMAASVQATTCLTWSQVKAELRDGGVARLWRDIDARAEQVVIGGSATLDLNGHTLTLPASSQSAFLVNAAELQIVGDGTIAGEGTSPAGGALARVTGGGRLIIRDEVHIRDFTSTSDAAGEKGGAICVQNGYLELDDVRFTGCRGASDAVGTVYMAGGDLRITSPNGYGFIRSASGTALCISSSATATILGGIFEAASENSVAMVLEGTSSRITGGVFRGPIDSTSARGVFCGGVYTVAPASVFLGNDCESLQVGDLHVVGRASSLAAADGKLTNGILAFDPRESIYSSAGLSVADGVTCASLDSTASPFVLSVYTPMGVTVNGTDIGIGLASGFDFRRTAKTLTLTEAGDYTLSGTNTAGGVRVTAAKSATVTLDNLDLRNTTGGSPFALADGTATTILLKGTNHLMTSTSPYTGLCLGVGSSLVLDKAAGETDDGAVLQVQGGDAGAGIGCGRSSSCGTITINGGSVWAYSLGNAAGIGSACGGQSGVITINGGLVRAFGGTGGAGIGAGTGNRYEDSRSAGVVINGGDVSALGGGGASGIGGGYVQCGNASCAFVTITGGKVYARSQSWGAGIGAGYGSAYSSACGAITISGGTVEGVGGGNSASGIGTATRGSVPTITVTGGSVTGTVNPTPKNASGETVYKVTVTGGWAKNASVVVAGLSIDDQTLLADEYGRVTLYLANGTYRFTANGAAWTATVAGAATAAVNVNTGVFVNGVDAGYASGAGWSYADHVLLLNAATNYVLAGTNTTPVDIAVAADATVTLDNFVCTNASSAAQTSVLEIRGGTTVRLVLKGENRLVLREADTTPSAVSLFAGATLTVGGDGSFAGLSDIDGIAATQASAVLFDGGTITGFAAPVTVDSTSVCTNRGAVWRGNAGTIGGLAGLSSVTLGGVSDKPLANRIWCSELQQGSLYVYGSNMTVNAKGELIGGLFAFDPLRADCVAAGVKLASGFSTYAKGNGVYEIIGATGVLVDGVDVSVGSGSGWKDYWTTHSLVFTDENEHTLTDELHADDHHFWVSAADGVAAKIRVDGKDGYAMLASVGEGVTIVGGTAYVVWELDPGLRITGGSVVLRSGGETGGVLSNGTERVSCVTITNDAWTTGTAVTLEGLPASYDVSGIVAIDGKVCVCLPNGTYYFTANGQRYSAKVADGNVTADDFWRTGVTLDGSDVGTLAAFDFTTKTLTLTAGGVLSGTNAEGGVCVVVATAENVTLDNLVLGGFDSEAPLTVASGTTAHLLLAGSNVLTAAGRNPGLKLDGAGANVILDKADGFTDAEVSLAAHAGGNAAGIGSACGQASGVVTIDGGTIEAWGGTGGAGIGAGTGNKTYKSPSGGVEIHGGVVIAHGGSGASGIGAGYVQSGGASCGFVRITGGRVTATAGNWGAGIGAGYSSTSKRSVCDTIDIRGGTIVAHNGGYNAADIGAATRGTVNTLGITGGNVATTSVSPQPTAAGADVFCVTVNGGWADGTPVAFTGLPASYGTNDLYAVAGQVNLYLPDGFYAFTANAAQYWASVDGAATTAVAGWKTGVFVNGKDVAAGDPSWTIDIASATVTLTESATYAVTGTNLYGALHFVVSAGATAALANLNLSGDFTGDGCVTIVGGQTRVDSLATARVVVSNGTVSAYSLGAGTGDLRIVGGSVDAYFLAAVPSNDTARVHCVTVPGEWTNGVRLAVAGLPEGYGTNDLFVVDRVLLLWLPNGAYSFTAGGYPWTATVADADTAAEISVVTGLTLDGIEVGTLPNYDYRTGVLTLGGVAVTNVLAGTNTAGTVTVALTNAATLILDRVYLAGGERAIVVSNDVAATILLRGSNTLGADDAAVLADGAVTIDSLSADDVDLLLVSSVSGTGSLHLVGGLVMAYAVTVRDSAETGGTLLAQTVGAVGGTLTLTGGSLTAITLAAVPSNETARVYKVTVPGGWEDGTRVALAGLAGYGTNDLVAASGELSLWLPDGDYVFTAGGYDWTAGVAGADVTAVCGELTGVTVDGRDVIFGSGTGWSFANGLLTIAEAGAYVLAGANEAGAVRVHVAADATLTLDGLKLVSPEKDRAVLSTADGKAVTLLLKGENVFIGGTGSSDHQPAVRVGATGTLTIDKAAGLTDDEATLTAICRGTSEAGAGIGSGRWDPSGGTVRILGGTVTAQGGVEGAGIGGAFNGKFRKVEIAGGIVTATGGRYAAGLGSGSVEGDVPVVISGGFVTATGGDGATDIGGAYRAITNGTITISGGTVVATRGTIGGSGQYSSTQRGSYFTTIAGGSVHATTVSPVASNATARVYKVTVAGDWEDGAAVAVAGLPADYGTNDLVAVNGALALWLKDGNYSFTANGVAYVATVAGADTEAGAPQVCVTQLGGATCTFATFAAAAGFATNGATIALLGDIAAEVLAESVTGLSFTLDGNGHALALTTENGTPVFAVDADETVRLADVCFAGGASSLVSATDGATLALTNCVLRDFAADVLVKVRDATVTVDGLVASNNACAAIVEAANATADAAAQTYRNGSFADNGDAVTLRLTAGVVAADASFVEGAIVSVEHNAALSLLDTLPREVKLDVPSAIFREGDLLVTNVSGTANLAAANVRICSSGYTAVGVGGNIYLASSTNFLYAVRPADTFVVYRTFGEALAAGDGSVVSLVRYRNVPQGLDVAVQDDAIAIGAGSNVTLRTVLRTTPDGTNTTWDAATTEAVTLTGALTVAGRLRLENVVLGAPVVLAGGVLDVGAGFALDGVSVMVELAAGLEPGGTAAIVSSVYTGEELFRHFHLSAGDLVFRVEANGLVVVKVEDKVARVGTTSYDTFAAAVGAVTNGGVVEIVATTNAISGEHRDDVKFGSGIVVPADFAFTVRSIRAMLTNDQVVVENNPTEPVVLALDGGSVELGAGARLALTNVVTTGTLTLAGEGLLDLKDFTGTMCVKPTRTGLIATNAADHASLQLGTGAGGVIVWKGTGAWWRDGSFSAKFVQTANGAGRIEIDDYGIKTSVNVASTTGSTTYHYQETDGRTGTDTNLTFGVAYCVNVSGETPYVVMPPKSCYGTNDNYLAYQNKSGTYVAFSESGGKGYATSDLPRSTERSDHQTKVSLIVRNYGVACEIANFYVVDSEQDVDDGLSEALDNPDDELKQTLKDIWDISDGVLDSVRILSILTGFATEWIGYNVTSWVQAAKALVDVIARLSCDVYVGDASKTGNYYAAKNVSKAYKQAISDGDPVYVFWDVSLPAYTLKNGKSITLNAAGAPAIDVSAIVSAVVGLAEENPLASIAISEITGAVVKELSKEGQERLEGNCTHAVKGADSSVMISVESGATLIVTKIDEDDFGSGTKIGAPLFDVSGTLRVSQCSLDDRAESAGFVKVRAGGLVSVGDSVHLRRSGARNVIVESGGRVNLTESGFGSRVGISGMTENGNVFSSAQYRPTDTNSYAYVFSNDSHSSDTCSLGIDPSTHDIFWNVVSPTVYLDLANLPVFDTQAEAQAVIPNAFVTRPDEMVKSVVDANTYHSYFSITDVPKAGTDKWTLSVDLTPAISNAVAAALASALPELLANATNAVPSAKVSTCAGLYYGIAGSQALQDLSDAKPAWQIGHGRIETITGTRPSETNGFYRLKETLLNKY